MPDEIEAVFGPVRGVVTYHDQDELLREWAPAFPGALPIEWEDYTLEEYTFAAADLPDVEFSGSRQRWLRRSDKSATDLLHVALYADGSQATRLSRRLKAPGDEVMDLEDNPGESFSVSGLHDVREYVEYLRSDPTKPVASSKVQVALSDIVEAIYVPFYRNLEELRYVDTPNHEHVVGSTWADIGAVGALLREHHASSCTWLQAVALDVSERATSATNRYVPPQDDAEKRLLDALAAARVPLARCEGVREAAPASAFLTDDGRSHYVFVSFRYPEGIRSASSASFPEVYREHSLDTAVSYLPVVLRISRKHSASFVARWLMSAEATGISAALRGCIEVGQPDALRQMRVEVPKRMEQIGYWVTMALLEQELRRATQIVAPMNPLTLELALQRVRRRHLIIAQENVPRNAAFDREMESLLKPLPYMLEYPVLVWERANEKMRYRQATALLLQLHRMTCLVGVEEMCDMYPERKLADIIGAEAAEEIKGRPTQGTWSKAVNQLNRLSGDLTTWRDWVRVLGEHSNERRALIYDRNGIEHPEFMVAEDDVDDALERCERFFDKVLPQLRASYHGSATYISIGRQLIEDSKGARVVVLDCERLDGAVEPFARVGLTLPAALADTIPENRIFTVRDNTVRTLRRFFQLQAVRKTIREIYVYAGEYERGQAKWSGIMSPEGRTMAAPQALFR